LENLLWPFVLLLFHPVYRENCVNVHTWATRLYVYVRVYIYIYSVCVRTRACVCVYVCVFVHTHIHTFTFCVLGKRSDVNVNQSCTQTEQRCNRQRSDTKHEHTGWPQWTQFLGISLERLPKSRLNQRQAVALQIRFQIQDLQSVARPLVCVWKFRNISWFRKIGGCKNLLKFVDLFQFCLKSDNNIGQQYWTLYI
jgi:hypothetical protein